MRKRLKSLLRSFARSCGCDIVSFDPRFNFEAKKPELLRRFGIRHALDIGANTGQFAAYLRGLGYEGRITSFEPLGAPFRVLSENLGKDPGWLGINAAVGAAAGSVKINVSLNSVSSSILPVADRHVSAHPDSAVVRVEEAKVVTVDGFLAEHPEFSGPFLLKADTQGFEDAVLDGAANSFVSIPLVLLEMSVEALYEGQALMPDLLKRMRALGYSLAICEPSDMDYTDLSVLQMDGWFMRESR